MLLPENIQPENSIYYNGAILLRELQNNGSGYFVDIFQRIKEKHNMSFPVFVLSLDWLYLVNLAVVDEEGEIKICS